MGAYIQWNRLIIEADSDEEFIAMWTEYFPRLTELSFDQIECDISSIQNISEDSYRAIALSLIEHEGLKEKLILRIPAVLERYFLHSGLHRLFSFESVSKLYQLEGKEEKRRSELVQDLRQALSKDFKPTEKIEVPDSEDQFETAEEVSSYIPRNKLKTTTQKRRTLVGLPVSMMEGEEDPAIQQDEEGIHELVMEEGPLEKRDLNELEESDIFDRNTLKLSEIKQLWLVDDYSEEVREVTESLVVGRDKPSNWCIAIPTISKQHFKIYKEANYYYIQDLNATNGTFLNGSALKGATLPLIEGDKIVIAITLKHAEGARSFTVLAKNPFD